MTTLLKSRWNSLWREARAARDLLRTQGLRALFRRYGWRLFLLIFAYYLIRDLTIYVLIPLLLFRSLA